MVGSREWVGRGPGGPAGAWVGGSGCLMVVGVRGEGGLGVVEG